MAEPARWQWFDAQSLSWLHAPQTRVPPPVLPLLPVELVPGEPLVFVDAVPGLPEPLVLKVLPLLVVPVPLPLKPLLVEPPVAVLVVSVELVVEPVVVEFVIAPVVAPVVADRPVLAVERELDELDEEVVPEPELLPEVSVVPPALEDDTVVVAEVEPAPCELEPEE